jgi:bifunctional UDP-N-acetylglucosamine pyrophosphorylase/glucosamine-1-phosphate N-acetyltransferase
MKVSFIHQETQRGTGDAARAAMDSPWGQQVARDSSSVMVLPGDLPLIPSELVRQLAEPLGKSEAVRLLSCELPNPTGYGRVVRRGKTGPVLRIVEEKDANLREKQIHEVGASIYLFQTIFLKSGLHRITDKNAQKEYYLTDLLGLASRAKKKIDTLKWEAHEDLRGINDPWELSEARILMNKRTLRKWAERGTNFIDISGTWIDTSVQLDEEVMIHSGVILRGSTRIKKGSVIGPRAVLQDMEIGEDVHIKTGTVGESSRVEAGASIGPYAHLRPGSVVGAKAKIGNFVELKKSKIGEGTSIAHLSYVGDAEVGRDVNIGCGFVTCNYDGRVIDGERKHRTVIEDEVFLGSDCQTIAPVRIGKGAYVASGSTITQNVEPGAMAIARSRQVNKPGYAQKLKKSSKN